MEVELCAAMPERLRSRPAFLPLTQLHERVQVYEVAVTQEPVGEHGEERRTDRHREDHVEAVAFERLQDVEEWQVRLRDRLEEPAFLERGDQPRMADEGEVRVQNERKAAARLHQLAVSLSVGEGRRSRAVRLGGSRASPGPRGRP